jgi:hypothetical protein
MDNFQAILMYQNQIYWSDENNKATTEDWEKWVFFFKNQFQNIGCNI